MQGKRLRLRRDAVNAVFRHNGEVITNVKAYHGMIDAVARSDASNDYRVATGTKLQLLENRFHGSFVKTVVRSFLNHDLARQRLQLLDKFGARTAQQQTVRPAEYREFRMVLRA